MDLNDLRNKTKMTQKEFATHFGISVRTYQKWEQGDRKPPEHDLIMITRLLKLEGLLGIKFRNEQHEKDYLRFIKKMKSQDVYHQTVAYLLALDEVVVDHVKDVFDFSTDSVYFDTALQHGWQTGTSYKTTRLIMNLWNGWCCDFDDEGEESSSPAFAVSEIFCCEYAPYYWEAIKLRYPEYSR